LNITGLAKFRIAIEGLHGVGKRGALKKRKKRYANGGEEWREAGKL